jgi:hypothetical protein
MINYLENYRVNEATSVADLLVIFRFSQEFKLGYVWSQLVPRFIFYLCFPYILPCFELILCDVFCSLFLVSCGCLIH